MNGTPVKYGLLDSKEKPGHNVTGIYQAGYLLESLEFCMTLAPGIKRIAVISDDSKTGRAYLSGIAILEQQKKLPVQVVERFRSNRFEEWKAALLRLQTQVDAFYIFNHNTLKDAAGRPVKQMDAGRWYLENIKIPEITHPGYHVEEGFLCTVDDSGFKQGYEGVQLMDRILKGVTPPYAPPRGNAMVNTVRAGQLGIDLTGIMGIEERIDSAKALK